MRVIIRIILLAFITNLSFCGILAAETSFDETELLTILWGDASNQLKIGFPSYEDIKNTPADSSDDFVELGGGPSCSFVDKNENFYFASYRFGQIKAFRKTSDVLFNLSREDSGFSKDIFGNSVSDFLVDSSFNIYIDAFPQRNYVSIIDTMGNLIKTLKPDQITSEYYISSINPGYNDVITFRFKGPDKVQVYTYRDTDFTLGGMGGWLAKDSNYYFIRSLDTNTFKFFKSGNPDSKGVPGWSEKTNIQYQNDIRFTEFLGVDNDMNLYVYIIETTGARKVLVYDINYSLLDEIQLFNDINKYEWSITPFMRTDGNVYEFRCLDDGLHVIRWSRKE